MSAPVSHLRPTMGYADILSGRPVSGADWQQMGGIANWLNGHGHQLVPWSAIGVQVDDGDTGDFHFYVAPSARAVERVWVVNVAALGAPAVVTCGSAAPVTVPTGGRRVVVREPLASRSSTPGDVLLEVVPGEGGAAYVASVAVYEQTRSLLELDAADRGVDTATLSPRMPVFDAANASVVGVADAYKNLDVRRAGFFAWSCPTYSGAPVVVTSGSPVDLFAVHAPTLGADSQPFQVELTCAVYAMVNSGEAVVRFTSGIDANESDVLVTSTSFAWSSELAVVYQEDLSAVDGRPLTLWETLSVSAFVDTAATLTIAAISIVRVPTSGTPL